MMNKELSNWLAGLVGDDGDRGQGKQPHQMGIIAALSAQIVAKAEQDLAAKWSHYAAVLERGPEAPKCIHPIMAKDL